MTPAPVYYLRDIANLIMLHEGVVPYMYLDHRANRTIGVGFLCESPQMHRKFGLDKEPAFMRDFEALGQIGRNRETNSRAARSFARDTTYRMPGPMIEEIMYSILLEQMAILGKRLPGYRAAPALAKAVIMDMAYNVGMSGLLNGFPRFCKAVGKKDWAECARQSARASSTKGRNAWARDTLMAAATGDCPAKV